MVVVMTYRVGSFSEKVSTCEVGKTLSARKHAHTQSIGDNCRLETLSTSKRLFLGEGQCIFHVPFDYFRVWRGKTAWCVNLWLMQALPDKFTMVSRRRMCAHVCCFYAHDFTSLIHCYLFLIQPSNAAWQKTESSILVFPTLILEFRVLAGIGESVRSVYNQPTVFWSAQFTIFE